MAEIYCSDGTIVLVDDVDFPVVSKISWYVAYPGSVKSREAGTGKMFGLRPFIWSRFNAQTPRQIYVVNGLMYDCRRENLTVEKNESHKNAISYAKRFSGPKSDNRLGFRGIGRRGALFRVIWPSSKRLVHGWFHTAEEAARAYDAAAFALWGTDCYLNFPEDYGLPPRAKVAA